MELIDTLHHISSLLKKQPEIIGHPAVKKAFTALEKAALAMERAANPFEDIVYTDYLDLKASLKGKISAKALPATNAILSQFGLSIRIGANGKADLERFLMDACKRKQTGEIVRALNRKPEDVYREQLFRMAKMNNAAVRNYIDRTYAEDMDLKKFMKANSIKEGKRKNRFSREASMENIEYKIVEVRSRI